VLWRGEVAQPHRAQLARPVAGQLLRSAVPVHVAAGLEVDEEDRVVGPLEQAAVPDLALAQRLLGALAVGHVERDADDAAGAVRPALDPAVALEPAPVAADARGGDAVLAPVALARGGRHVPGTAHRGAVVRVDGGEEVGGGGGALDAPQRAGGAGVGDAVGGEIPLPRDHARGVECPADPGRPVGVGRWRPGG
jgi:hypothetical protein